MKTLICFSAMVLCLTLEGSSALGQTKESPPTSPLIIRTDLGYGWSLSIVADAKSTTSRVGYSSSGFLESTNASISIRDCEKMAEVIEMAAAAVQNDKRFESERFGDVMITIGTAKVNVLGKDGKYTPEETKVVILQGGEKGLFTKPLAMNLLPKDAEKFSKALRNAPGIYARLKASINYDAIWKAN